MFHHLHLPLMKTEHTPHHKTTATTIASVICAILIVAIIGTMVTLVALDKLKHKPKPPVNTGASAFIDFVNKKRTI